MFTQEKNSASVGIHPLTSEGWDSFKSALTANELGWAGLQGFAGKPGQVCLLPDGKGGMSKVLAGYDVNEGIRWSLAALPEQLPAGDYHLECDWDVDGIVQASIGWGLGCYRFDQYTQAEAKPLPTLYVDAGQQAQVDAFVQAITLVRDLVNQPANRMMPEQLAAATEQLAAQFGAGFHQVVGDELLEQNYPAIHAVGRASHHAPRLLRLTWGKDSDPPITLVGKGVCFDTGGLDIKPSQFMRLMKKDMGGAAHVLGLARLIMQLAMPVRLTVLVPAVDNAIGGDAFRPGDILATRAGKHVEVDNTDAEGRLILCDALAAAAEHAPAAILDFATLTGAARVALGTEVPVFFSNDRDLVSALQEAAETADELIWNLPLYKPYFEQLKSNCADFINSGGSYGGAITAALFLNEFVPENIPWAHFDIMAWNVRKRSGRPVGGEAMGLFAAHAWLESFCSRS